MAERRWMLFVDGENFAIRGLEVAKEHSVTLAEGPCYRKDVFVWLPNVSATRVLAQPQKGNRLEKYAVRAHYYTSAVGDEPKLREIRQTIRGLGFQPLVFKREKEKKSKGVDITLTKDLLVNAFYNNYDVAVLIAGDGDYVPVIDEIKRMGKTVYVVFFTEPCAGLNEDLRWSPDKFFTLSPTFVKCWTTTGGVGGDGRPLRETVDGQS